MGDGIFANFGCVFFCSVTKQMYLIQHSNSGFVNNVFLKQWKKKMLRSFGFILRFVDFETEYSELVKCCMAQNRSLQKGYLYIM